MKRYVAVLVLIIFTLLTGCGGADPTVNAVSGQQKGAATPRWQYSAAVRITGLYTPVGRQELVVALYEGGRSTLMRLDAAGKTIGSPLQLPGALGGSTPDFARFLSVSPGTASVMDLSGSVLWNARVQEGKGSPGLNLLPDGSAVIMSLLTEAVEGVYTHAIDLTGKTLWKIDGPEAGEFAGVSAEELFFWNNRSLWRIRPDGTGRKELLSREQRVGSMEISTDGSTIVVVGEPGGKIYDHEGKPVAGLPSGELHTVTSDGRRILLKQNGTYVLFDRQGKAVWNVAATPQMFAELASDGSWFLTAAKSASKEALQATLYDASGKLIWESTVDLASENWAALPKLAISTETKLAYVCVGKQLFAWSLSRN